MYFNSLRVCGWNSGVSLCNNNHLDWCFTILLILYYRLGVLAASTKNCNIFHKLSLRIYKHYCMIADYFFTVPCDDHPIILFV